MLGLGKASLRWWGTGRAAEGWNGYRSEALGDPDPGADERALGAWRLGGRWASLNFLVFGPLSDGDG